MTKGMITRTVKHIWLLFHKCTIFALIEVLLSPKAQSKLTKAECLGIFICLTPYFYLFRSELSFISGETKKKERKKQHHSFDKFPAVDVLCVKRNMLLEWFHITKFTNSQSLGTRHNSCSSVQLKQESSRVERIIPE